MKSIRVIVALLRSMVTGLVMLFCNAVVAQPGKAVELRQTLPTYNLELGWHKTRLVIFPSPIKDGDLGDKYVLAQPLEKPANILKVKSGEKDFPPSNLHVVTADGKVYSFNVTYNEYAPDFPVDMGKQKPYAPATFPGVSLNSKQVEDLAGNVSGRNGFLHGGTFRKYGMKLTVEGIYIKDDVLFFQFNLRNKTQIPYDCGSLRFYIRDKKKVRRTASQDKEIEPLYQQMTGSPQSEKGQSIIAAFPRFTIAEKKFLAIELMELGGDRNPSVRIDQEKLLKARGL